MKVMLLEVKGGAGDYVVGPWRRIVSVQDEAEFLGTIRALVLSEAKNTIKDEGQQIDILRSIKISLKETGLAEYPEEPEKQAELYRKLYGVKDNL